MAELKLRPADLTVTSERSFILDAWLRSFKKSSYSGVIPNNRYNEVTTEAILQLLERGMEILLLEGADVETYIGFVAFESAEIPVVHYVYVKPMLRTDPKFLDESPRFGQKLLMAAGVRPREPWIYTFRTRDSRKFTGGIFVKAIACRKNLEPVRRDKPHNGNT